MAEITLVNPNCNCCSGSGSGSGSCRCSIFDAGKALGECSTSSVKTACKTAFYLSVTLSYSQCSGLPIGSCGSAASGAETGLDGPETGSAQDCVVDCPSCCDLFDQSFEIPLVCYGDLIVSKNLVEGSPEYIECFGGSVIGLLPNGSYGSCLTHKKCPYFVFFSDGTGHLAIPIDHWILHFYFPGYDGGLTVNSCDPLQITINASAFCGDQVNDVSAPCLANCLGRNGWEYPSWIDQDLTLADVTFDCSCIKATMILTENSIGGGGGGGGPII
jgi:hypothetical protein